MIAPSDTHRRAALRGREAVAWWRIASGVWAARLYAAMFAVLSIFPLLNRDAPDWSGGLTLAVIGIGLLVASELLRRGNRIAALALFGAFVAAKLATWLVAGVPLYHALLWTIVIAGALGNGVWGAFELAAVRREAALIPPAPVRDAPQRAIR